MKIATKCIGRFLTQIVLLAIVLATGCGDRGAKKQFLSIGTAPTGGAFFVVGNAIASAVNAAPETSEADQPQWQVSSESTKGTQENIRRLDSGELDFALANAAISYFAVRGLGDWKREYNIRSVMTLAPNIAFFITPQSTGIKTIADLKGKRVVLGPSGAGFDYFVRPILEAHGVSYDDFTPLYATQTASVDMLADGSASAAFLGGALPTASITQACATQDIYFIPFDPKAKDELIAAYPFFRPVIVVASKYSDLKKDYRGMVVGAMQLITSANTPEETVYAFTKRLYENRDKVVQQHPAGKTINPINVVRDTGTPFHPGAIRFYKEIGIWPETEPDSNAAAN